ncbi:hypothetical protein JHK85_001387 [Glycine max]|nr:hypothetical protein JHK85_001387 [Glycine max]KAG5088742.1 hypothetical protein JHK86_001354 [Glycine max]
MLSSYDTNGLLHEALDLLRDMQVMRVKLSEIGMISITHVLTELAERVIGESHACLSYARRVFDGLCKASIICWTAMMKAYIHCNNLNEVSSEIDIAFARDSTILTPEPLVDYPAPYEILPTDSAEPPSLDNSPSDGLAEFQRY